MQESRASSMLEELLFGDMKTTAEMEETLSAHQLVNEKGCIVGVCMIVNGDLRGEITDAASGTSSGKRAFQKRLEDAFAWERVHALTTMKGNRVVLLAPNLPDIKERLSRVIQKFESDLSGRYPDIRLHIGIGVSEDNHSDIKKSYRQACQALAASGIGRTKERIISYESLGFLSLLLNITDLSVLKNYYMKTLGALIEYDKVNRTDLYQTLETYYENDSDLQSTAQKLFIHKNTLKYRLERIGEILGSNIRTTDDSLCIGVALKVGKILTAKASNAEDMQND